MTQKPLETSTSTPRPDLAAAEKKSGIEAATETVGKELDTATAAARDEANDIARRAQETATGHARAAKNAVADEADETASQIREAGSAFDPGSFADIAAGHLADNLASAADAMRGTDLQALKDDLTEFARRNPLVFFGGAAVLGFMAGRVAKASERVEPRLPAPAHPYDPPVDRRTAWEA